MKLQLIKDNKYKLTYKGKSVIVTLLSNNKPINNKYDLYLELYDLIQDILYFDFQIENNMFSNQYHINITLENSKSIFNVFTDDEIEQLENDIDELEYDL